jgi:glycoside/pentoside/hexuronide:cation symporter, GPH family
MVGHQRLAKGQLAGYASGSLATGVFSAVPSVLLLYYCTQQVGISPAIAGMIVFVTKAFAIVWDPFVGHWSDHTRSRWGRRAPFMAVGAVTVPLAFIAVFTAQGGNPAATASLIAVGYLLLTLAYSLFAVPYSTVPAEISNETSERERVLTWRIGCAMLGALIGSGLAPHLVEWFGSGADGYRMMAVTVAIICGLGMVAATDVTRRLSDPSTVPISPSSKSTHDWRAVWTDRAFLRLAIGYLLFLAGAGFLSSAAPYFVVILMHANASAAGTLLGLLLLMSILSMPVWQRLLRHYTVGRLLIGAVTLFALGGVALLAMEPQRDVLLVYALFMTIGVAFGGLQLVPFAMLAHLVHARAEEGNNSQGTFTGVWTACAKIGLAAGPALLAAGLALIGVPKPGFDWSASMQLSLLYLVAFLPMLLVAAGLVFAVRSKKANP